jgi:hypothetical protein
MATRVNSVAALTLSAAVLMSCSSPTSPDAVAAVTPGDLQSDIANRLADAGEQPESVTCKEPLVGEVGQSARCDVMLSATNSFEPIVTVTAIEDDSIVYEMIPALSQAQLEQQVTRLVVDAGSPADTMATCLSGLLGQAGAVAQCDVRAAGTSLRRTAQVTSVEGLTMKFDLIPLLTKVEIENSLLDELATHLGGKRPESAVCGGDLEGRIGNTVDCTVTAAGETADLTLTVTAVDGTKIDYSYVPRR